MLLNINGSITTDPFNILNEQRRFYQELYMQRNKNNEAIKSFLRELSIPKLSEEQKMSCEGKITSEECALLITDLLRHLNIFLATTTREYELVEFIT